MKIINYVGTEAPSIVIESTKDLYPLLDYFQAKIIVLEELGRVIPETSERCSRFISNVMAECEFNGFGDYQDIENIEHG